MKVIKKILLGCACLSVLGTTACNNSDKPMSQEEMSQEEMFQEFHSIVDSAKKQEQWSISGVLRNEDSTQKAFMTTDSNGIYYRNYSGHDFSKITEIDVFRDQEDYIFCVNLAEDNADIICKNIDKDTYESQYKTLASASNPIPDFLNILEAESIDELKKIVKEELVVSNNASLPVTIDVNLDNKYDEESSKKFLNLNVVVQYEVDGNKHQTEVEIVTYDGKIKSMYVLSTDGDYANTYEVEYKTNQDIVRKDVTIVQ